MGNCILKTDTEEPSVIIGNRYSQITLSQFRILDTIGHGSFGTVMKTHHTPSNQTYAMKQMSKSQIIAKNSVNQVLSEREILTQLQNPYIVPIKLAFQDQYNLYLILKLMQNGDLRTLLNKFQKLSESKTKFIVCCLIKGLEYIHSNNIIHRDIKPENLVFDKKGFLRLTDFGIARDAKLLSNDNSGTPGYMAPEVLFREVHGCCSDFYAVGIIIYECMYGYRPYRSRTREELRIEIHARSVKIERPPQAWSSEAADFVNQLIRKKPQKRLGFTGVDEVYAHPWLADVNWGNFVSKVKSPLLSFCAQTSKSKPQKAETQRIERPSRRQQELFREYYYDASMKSTGLEVLNTTAE